MEKIYIAKAVSTGGRAGHVKTADGVINMELRAPVEMGGESGYANPEELFAAGYAACFNSAAELSARRMRLDGSQIEIQVEIGIGQDKERGGFGLEAKITGLFPASVTPEDARKIMESAHELCPYSRAIKGNVPVELAERTK